MKTFTRWLLALLLVATPLVALVERASANTELVPSTRLVAPYWDIAGSRNTLFFLTNVSSSVDLLTVLPNGSPPVQPARGVHVEFYDKTCVRQNIVVNLSAGDLDQLDIKLLGGTASGQGWADMDVRAGDAQRNRDGIQCNVLVGMVLNADSAGDFAVVYPMAAGTGSSTLGVSPCLPAVLGDAIVTHDANGSATGWAGGYEPFPGRVFVPFFFAEGGPAGMTSQAVIAAPADGNWFDGAVGAFACPGGVPCVEGESPGQNLTGLTLPIAKAGWLMDGTSLFWDACENKESRSFGGHWINNKLSDPPGGAGLNLGPKAVETFPWNHPGLSCKNLANFPSADDDAAGAGKGAAIGWIDVPNTLVDSSVNVNGAPDPSNAVPSPRGLVGIVIQNTTLLRKQGDVIRMWGDPVYGLRGPAAQAGNPGGYSWTDIVSHADLN